MTTKNSDLVANFEASPQVFNNSALLSGEIRVAQGTIELAAGDSTDKDIGMFAPNPSHATITQLCVASDGLGGSCTFNVGLYLPDGTVKDEDVFATTVSDAAGMTDLRFEAADINTAGQRVFELAGDSTDPGDYYYVAATFNATGGTAGTMSFLIHYVVN